MKPGRVTSHLAHQLRRRVEALAAPIRDFVAELSEPIRDVLPVALLTQAAMLAFGMTLLLSYAIARWTFRRRREEAVRLGPVKGRVHIFWDIEARPLQMHDHR